MRAGFAGALLMMMICAVNAMPAAAQSDTPGTLTMKLTHANVSYGRDTVVTGRGDRALVGRSIALEWRATPADAWQAIASTTLRGDGTYRVSGRPSGSGALRVTLDPGAAASASSESSHSAEAPIAVLTHVAVAARTLHVRVGQSARVRGRIAPGSAGRRVWLQVHRAGRWITIKRARTRAGGAFAVSVRVRALGSLPARLEVEGGGPVVGGGKNLGRLDAARAALASWYGPGLYGRRLGCGGTLRVGQLGVANKSLPCGTKVTLRYHGRSVRVPVIDRGPYVGPREFDLTAATARRLGFHAVGTVWVTR